MLKYKILFPTVFKKDLHKDVAGDTSGNFEKLLLALVQVRCFGARLYDLYITQYSLN